MGIKIIKTSGVNASREVSNHYFEEILDTSDEWIASRTGIRKRYFVQDENTADMALKVAMEFRKDVESGLDIKLILHASFSPDLIVPSIAAKIQKELGVQEDVYCADINMGCTGFVGALILAERYLKAGESGIIVASETISDYLDFTDRTTAVLFGDGAAGVIVTKTEDSCYFAQMNTYGNDTDLFMKKNGKVSMIGNNVYRFAVDKVPKSVRSVLERAEIGTDRIDHVICHQANIRIIEQIIRHTEIDESKFHVNLDRYGNTSAASVPLVLHEAAQSGKLRSGDKVLLCAFGAGLTVATILMEW